jgi:predicted secreted protein
MKTKIINLIVKKAGIVALVLIGMIAIKTSANNQSQLNQSISDAVRSIDIVDAGGTTVASPAVAFSAATFSFATQDTTGTLGVSAERIRVYNPTSTATWTASVAGSATTAVWTAGSNYYDFNDANGGGYTDGAGDADLFGGQLLVAPAGGTLAGVSGCATTNVSLGSNSAFNQGTVDSITLASGAAGASTYCRWDVTNIGLTQRIPASQVSGSYAVNLVLSII